MSNKLARTIEYDKFRHLMILYDKMKIYSKKLEKELKGIEKGIYTEKFFAELYDSCDKTWNK